MNSRVSPVLINDRRVIFQQQLPFSTEKKRGAIPSETDSPGTISPGANQNTRW
ncbi:MAG: hypothetical protein R3C41_17795 [Calditrichia bacterium]